MKRPPELPTQALDPLIDAIALRIASVVAERVLDELSRMPKVEPQALSVAEAATYLGVSTPNVYRLIEAGTLEAIRIGPRRTLISRGALDALLNKGMAS